MYNTAKQLTAIREQLPNAAITNCPSHLTATAHHIMLPAEPQTPPLEQYTMLILRQSCTSASCCGIFSHMFCHSRCDRGCVILCRCIGWPPYLCTWLMHKHLALNLSCSAATTMQASCTSTGQVFVNRGINQPKTCQ